MGEVVVLQPQDYLKDRLPREPLIYSPMKSRRKPNSCSNPNFTRSNRRKRCPTGLRKNNNNNNPMVASPPAKDLVMGQVKILKRGEALKETTVAVKDRVLEVVEKATVVDLEDFVLSSTDRLGPEPEMVPKQLRLSDFYAGSAFVSSPPPSSLPLPAFFTKKSVLTEKDDVTNDLCRILGLDLQ